MVPPERGTLVDVAIPPHCYMLSQVPLSGVSMLMSGVAKMAPLGRAESAMGWIGLFSRPFFALFGTQIFYACHALALVRRFSSIAAAIGAVLRGFGKTRIKSSVAGTASIDGRCSELLATPGADRRESSGKPD